jgi:Uma2 family endonuclease
MSTTAEPPVAGDLPALPPFPVSFEEFLAWAPESTLVEWVDGEVVVMSPASADHQDLLRFILMVVGEFVDTHGLGRVLFAPFLMRLITRPSGREPDLLFISNEHLDRLRPGYLDGPADLVVEIISPESVSRDRGDKFAEYEAGGVREYWLIDPERLEALFYLLDADGRFRRADAVDGVFRSSVLPGFWLRVDWLWQRPLPRPAEIRRELGTA